MTERTVEHVRFTTWSLLGGVALVFAGSKLMSTAYDARRALGWVIGAFVLATLLLPLVSWLDKYIPRIFAILVVMFTFLLSTAFIGYIAARSVADQTAKLQEIIAGRARELETSQKFGDFARRIELSHRAEQFVRAIPDRLRGGSPSEAIRSAATRGLAFFVTAIMTLFLLSALPKLARGSLRLVHDRDRRDILNRVAIAAYRGGFVFVRLQIGRSMTIGFVAYMLALVADVDGAAALGVWAAMFALIPVLGSLIGFFPIVVLAAFDSVPVAIALAIAFLGVELADTFLLQRDIAKSSIELGPLVTALAGFLGLEAYGIGGAGAALVMAAVASAAVREWGAMQNERAGIAADTLKSPVAPASA